MANIFLDLFVSCLLEGGNLRSFAMMTENEISKMEKFQKNKAYNEYIIDKTFPIWKCYMNWSWCEP